MKKHQRGHIEAEYGKRTALGRVITVAFWALVLALILTGIGYVQFAVWNECRESHSFLYCLRVLAR